MPYPSYNYANNNYSNNNYPYYQQYQQNYIPQAQVQPIQNGIYGRLVDSFDMITANDVPMSGEPATFIKRDLSEVQVRMWNSNGQIVTNVYKPDRATKTEDTTNVSSDDLKCLYNSMSDLQTSLNARFDKIDDYFAKNSARKAGKSDE